MRKKTKTTLGVFVALVAVMCFEIMYGLHLMAVENRYGDLQEVYFLSKSGDVVMDNHQRVGLISKVASRIFVEENGARLDFCDWVSNGRKQPVAFVVYSVGSTKKLPPAPSYEEVMVLVENQKLQPVFSY